MKRYKKHSLFYENETNTYDLGFILNNLVRNKYLENIISKLKTTQFVTMVIPTLRSFIKTQSEPVAAPDLYTCPGRHYSRLGM